MRPARLTSPPYFPSSWLPVFGWGFCFSNTHRQPYKATTYFFIYICSTLSSSPQTMVRCHPHTFRPGGALYFGAQTKEPTMARAQLMPRALYGPIGSSGSKIWVHGGGCCHGERGPKPLKGWAVAAHVDCCVLSLCFVLWLAIEY